MDINQFSAQIAAGQALSAEVDIGGWTPVGIIVPAGWTTASLSFQVSADGGQTWGEMLTAAGSAFSVSSITGGAQAYVALDPTTLRGIQSLKVRSGTSASPVNQTNAVTVTVVGRFWP